jgi:hypothetical protein
MPLPSSPDAISLSQVNTELGLSASALISMNDAAVRTLFGVASGQISMSQGYGKANQFAFTISSNQTNANLRTLAVNAGWNQSSKVVATIGSGVYISSNTTGTPGLTVDGSFPGGVDLINNGFIIGMGGAGGAGGSFADGFAGAGGGLALSVSVAVTVTNNGTIGGGGGGGGGGAASAIFNPFNNNFLYFGGGGGGGGRTGATNSSGGAGGNPGVFDVPGDAGGAGTSGGAGVGGAGALSGTGGTGGDWGSAGSVGSAANPAPAPGGAGGAAGAAISGNSNITYVATGTRLGAIT